MHLNLLVVFQTLLDIHSILRYLVLLFVLGSIFKSLAGWLGKHHYSKTDNILSLLAMIFVHLQLVAGFVLFFMSDIVQSGLSNMGEAMKEPVTRFFTVEHSSIMLIGIILITVGRVKAKKATAGWKKHKRTFLWFLIGLIIILVGIPWPFSQVGRPWF